jgi:zinc D-Ala-D-Ala carboxypeptidase
MELQNFRISEFDSPDLKGSGEEMRTNFLKKLQEARTLAGIPFSINSGYRTKAYNDSLIRRGIKASPNSSHLKGLACDIACNSSTERALIMSSLIKVGFKRIGIGSTFIHVDLDLDKPQNVFWLY